MRLLDRSFGLGLVGLALLLTGCSGARLLMPTPNVHLDAKRDYYANLAPELKDTQVSLFYITDRGPERNEQGDLRYGHERSPSLGFGTAVVDLGVDLTWEELLAASGTQRRLKRVTLELGEMKEIVRGPTEPLPYTETDDRIIEEPTLVAERAEATEVFRRVIAQQRIAGDKLAYSVHRFTIYTSPADHAIGIAAKLFASPRGRIGTLGLENAPDDLRADLKFGKANVAFVNFSGASDESGSQADLYGHSYFRDAPTVSSDLVLTLRDDLDPGTPGRPLAPLGLRFWQVPSGYPAVQPAQ